MESTEIFDVILTKGEKRHNGRKTYRILGPTGKALGLIAYNPAIRAFVFLPWSANVFFHGKWLATIAEHVRVINSQTKYRKVFEVAVSPEQHQVLEEIVSEHALRHNPNEFFTNCSRCIHKLKSK